VLNLENKLNGKDSEMEVIAKLGKRLAERNSSISKELSFLSHQNSIIKEQLSQAKHDLENKTKILINCGIYTELESPSTSQSESYFPLRNSYSTLSEDLRKQQIKDLEFENEDIKKRLESKIIEFDSLTRRYNILKQQNQDDKYLLNQNTLNSKTSS